MTITQLDVGDNYTIDPSTAGTDAGTKGLPPWMEWSGGTAQGTAKLPSGFRRITLAGFTSPTATIADASVDIAPVALPADAKSPWRVAIFAPNGAYMTANGLDGVPTIGTPQVRLTRSAPNRAVVKFALGHDTKNVLGASFDKWSDGTARPIKRGMEITVEYRDEGTGALVPTFRGRIFQIESGDAVTVTAYDRLMDLYQTTGQYLSHAGQTQGVRSTGRTASGTDYIYEMGDTLGIITGVDSINTIKMDALANMVKNMESTNAIIIHGLPTGDGITPEAGDIITKIHTQVSAVMEGATATTAGSQYKNLTYNIDIAAYVFEKQGETFVELGRGAGFTSITHAVTGTIGQNFTEYLNNAPVNVTFSQPVTIRDPANTYIGFRCQANQWMARYATGQVTQWGPDRSTTRYTTAGVDYYSSSNLGATWSNYTETARFETALTFTHQGASINPSSATISGTTVIIAQASIPAGPSGTYISTIEAGTGINVDYYEADKAPLAEIIKELIEAAGLNPDTGNANLGLVTLYTLVTTDYLTAIHSIMDARGYGIKDSIADAGTIALLPEHTTDEAPIMSITTDPLGAGEKVILSHALTVHWAAEKATVAYIAENATASGLPLALETDDGLLDGSLIEALQTPLSAINVDNTLGTHDMMAHKAAGAIRRLHTNTIEGTVVLAGYRPMLWDISGAGIGGQPIELDVPEYNAQGVAIPTELELADGITTVRLDNIRTQDRSGVAQSMGLVEGSVSNDASLLPKTVYIFGKADGNNQIAEGDSFQTLDSITLIRTDGTTLLQNNANYLKTATDTAGYLHLLAIFPEAAGTYTSVSPISLAVAEITTGGGTQHITAVIEPPKYILDNQNIHIDLRLQNP